MNKVIPIIIVTWNSEKDIETCLLSVYKQTYKNIKVIVVDNNSSDSTVKIIQENFRNTELIRLPQNIFLTGGNNLGIKHAIKKYNPDFLMVLNPDTKLDNDVLEKLYNTISVNKKIGAVGPKIKFFNNENEGKINSAGLIYDGFIQSYDIGFMDKDEGQYDIEIERFGVSGACILYRKKMLDEIGLYWEKIKLYMDEVELFIRAKNADWKIIYNGKATVHHSYMKSTSQEKLEKIEKIKLNTWLWIALRHYPLKSKLAMFKIWILSQFN